MNNQNNNSVGSKMILGIISIVSLIVLGLKFETYSYEIYIPKATQSGSFTGYELLKSIRGTEKIIGFLILFLIILNSVFIINVILAFRNKALNRKLICVLTILHPIDAIVLYFRLKAFVSEFSSIGDKVGVGCYVNIGVSICILLAGIVNIIIEEKK